MVVLSVKQSFTVEDLSLVERRVRFHQVKVEERHRHRDIDIAVTMSQTMSLT